MYTADHSRAGKARRFGPSPVPVLPIAALLAPILFAACAPAGSPEAPAVSVVDDSGRTVALAAPARRVFSVIPSLTESVTALDAGVLVARTRFDRAPELAHLPSLGGTIQPNLEALAGLDPDLVITWADASQRAVGERVDALGIPVYRAEVQTIADVRGHLRRLGTLLARPGRAAALVDSLDLALDGVAAAVQGRERVDVYYSVWHDPPQTTGPGTFIDQVIEHAGGRNIFSDATRSWPRVSIEAIMRRDPDALVIARHAPGAPGAPWLEGPGWRELRAVRNGRYLLVDGDLFNRPGPQVAEAARRMAHFLHGPR
ncbi:MAG: ABC transporter substrate-binding protein [Gemmatimonadales bacterium]|nr:ABC transporter substrate-binding protein [Gemmatimonadales bacterium]MYK01379.1 ABC transporter substrate-binding protein [Candidatus Palauibacter ramosifaciens]